MLCPGPHTQAFTTLAAQAGSGEDAPLSATTGVSSTCPLLSQELLRRHAVNGTILLAFADAGMIELFGATWLRSLQSSGITYWLVAAADSAAAETALRLGLSQCASLELSGTKKPGNSHVTRPSYPLTCYIAELRFSHGPPSQSLP